MSNAALPILDEIDRRKADIDALRPLDPEVEQRVMDKFRLDWNYNSNAIEGNTLTLGETKIFLLEGLTAKGKPLKDHLDIKGHDEAIDFLLQFVRNEEILTEKDIRAFHEVLLKEPYEIDSVTPDGKIVKRSVELGRYKTMPNHVRTSTGKIHYYATPEETPARMQELMAWYNSEEEKGDLHPVLISTLFHHRFTEVHPFDDGNGRMARILSNLILMKHSYPPVVIRQEKRDEYLYALRQADEGEYGSLIEFMSTELINSMDLYKRAAEGEDIYELVDFDKKLALLTQRIESLEEDLPPVKTIEYQSNIFEKLIQPLFMRLHARYQEIDGLFQTTDSYHHSRWGRRIETEKESNRPHYLSEMKRILASKVISSFHVTDTWKGFTLNEKKALSCIIILTLSKREFELAYHISGIDPKPFLVMSGRYDETFSPKQIDKYASVILDGIYKALESLTDKRTAELKALREKNKGAP